MDISDSSWGSQSGTFEDLIKEHRTYIRKTILADSSDPSSPKGGKGIKDGEKTEAEDIAEAIALLLSFASAVELLLQRASQRPWRSIPELNTPIKSLIDQLLQGGDSEGAINRLIRYCKAAIAIFGEAHMGVERKLEELSTHLADELRPSKIKEQTKVAGLSKLFGLQEVAYWREFCKRVRRLDPDAMRDLA